MISGIKIKNVEIIKLQFFDDFPDGDLVIGEAKKNIPFEIKRIYCITNLFNKKAKRGHHAHKKLDQAIFCVSGSFFLSLDDGVNRQDVLLNTPHIGIRLSPLLWHTMQKFSSDCVILVFASDYYNEGDYIRDYGEFVKYVNDQKNGN